MRYGVTGYRVAVVATPLFFGCAIISQTKLWRSDAGSSKSTKPLREENYSAVTKKKRRMHGLNRLVEG
jgi:hypothetical protein